MVGRDWIFQSNINFYDIDKAIRNLKTITWRVTFFKKEIQKGDKVFIWRNGPEAGIIAIGTIQTDIMEITLKNDEKKYFINNKLNVLKNNEVGVKVRIDKIMDKPILRDTLISQPQLSNMTILRNCRGTNFQLTNIEAEALKNMVK